MPSACCPFDNPNPLCFEEDMCGFDITAVGTDACPTMGTYEGTPPAPGDALMVPTTLIRSGQPWFVEFKWGTSGSMTTAITGHWNLAVYVHRLDQAGVTSKTKTVPYVPSDPHSYTEQITFADGELPDGLYEVYGSVEAEAPGPAILRVAGVSDGPIVKIYTPK